MTSVGELLKSLRNERKLSQEALAKELGVHQTTISGIECNERLPSAELVMALSRFFGVPIEQLMDKNAWDASRSLSRAARGIVVAAPA